MCNEVQFVIFFSIFYFAFSNSIVNEMPSHNVNTGLSVTMLCSCSICSRSLSSHLMEHWRSSDHLCNLGMHVLVTRHFSIRRGRFNCLIILVEFRMIFDLWVSEFVFFCSPAKEGFAFDGIRPFPRSLHWSSNRVGH